MWWYLASLPIVIPMITVLLGRFFWSAAGGAPPRKRRLLVRPPPRGFPVILPVLDPGRPLPLATDERRTGDSPEVGSVDNAVEANPIVIEAAMVIGELAFGIAEGASDLYRDTREAHEAVRIPMPTVPRPETAVEAVMELRRRRGEATGQKPAVE